MPNIITELQQYACKLVDTLGEAGINLREHLKDPASFGKLLDEQSQEIATLNESIERAKVTLPDGTGREVYAWEYEALERLAKDNQIEVGDLLGDRISIENDSVVKGEYRFKGLHNISALAGLVNLQKLALPGNGIQDVSALSELTNLLSLELRDNEIEDIGAVGAVTNLQTLYIEGNRIQDIGVLAGLPNLQGLYLADNPLLMQKSQEKIIRALRQRVRHVLDY